MLFRAATQSNERATWALPSLRWSLPPPHALPLAPGGLWEEGPAPCFGRNTCTLLTPSLLSQYVPWCPVPAASHEIPFRRQHFRESPNAHQLGRGALKQRQPRRLRQERRPRSPARDLVLQQRPACKPVSHIRTLPLSPSHFKFSSPSSPRVLMNAASGPFSARPA